MIHYHLGLIYSWCPKYFTTSANAMCHHLQLCKLASAVVDTDDNNQRRNPTLMTLVRTTLYSAKISNTLPHCSSTTPLSNWEAVNTLLHSSHQNQCSGFTTQHNGVYCPLSNEHNHFAFSQYCRSFIISKVLYLMLQST